MLGYSLETWQNSSVMRLLPWAGSDRNIWELSLAFSAITINNKSVQTTHSLRLSSNTHISPLASGTRSSELRKPDLTFTCLPFHFLLLTLCKLITKLVPWHFDSPRVPPESFGQNLLSFRSLLQFDEPFNWSQHVFSIPQAPVLKPALSLQTLQKIIIRVTFLCLRNWQPHSF